MEGPLPSLEIGIPLLDCWDGNNSTEQDTQQLPHLLQSSAVTHCIFIWPVLLYLLYYTLLYHMCTWTSSLLTVSSVFFFCYCCWCWFLFFEVFFMVILLFNHILKQFVPIIWTCKVWIPRPAFESNFFIFEKYIFCLLNKIICLLSHISNSRPEWWISSMIYRKGIPFWSETLDILLFFFKQMSSFSYDCMLVASNLNGSLNVLCLFRPSLFAVHQNVSHSTWYYSWELSGK